MSAESTIRKILISKPITAYLEQKGFLPVKQTPGRLWYKCPFPDHEETKPSFVVYVDGEFENFYCFGCGGKYSIIHLVAKLENIPFKTAVEKLSDGEVISDFDETKFILKKLEAQFSHPIDNLGISDALLIMSDYCRSYEESIERDKTEIENIDNLWKVVDDAILDCDFNAIKEFEPKLPLGLRNRRAIFEKQKKIRK